MPTILLVEDEADNMDMLTRRLRKRGYEVLTAVDGEQACAAAEARQPDLILMDVKMPVLDGLEATRRLKRTGRTRGIPVIALTAHAMTGDREKALEAGCDDYETKPIDLPSLVDKIERLLRRGVTA